MNTTDFEKIALGFFDSSTLNMFLDGSQYGFNNFFNKDIKRIGYSVNLTTDIIKQAKNAHVDLILTHHNIWEDYFELREDCLKLLDQYQLIHFFNHLPLDSASFGPTKTLAKNLGVDIISEFSKYENLSFGVVGEFKEPIDLLSLVKKVEIILNHKIRYWENHDRKVKKIGIVSGSGGDLESLHEAKQLNCDTYLTGEKKLKTILYTKHNQMNFLLGSHTFTELGGIREYANLIKSKMEDIEIIQLNEENIE